MDINVASALVLFLAVFGIVGIWFLRCGRAEQSRQMRSFAKRTLRYAGVGLILGLAFLTSDFGADTRPSLAQTGLVAITVCSFLLLYAAAWAFTAADDESLEWVNLTGRALLLTGQPDLAAFYALPARSSVAATVLPPVRRRTHYVVEPAPGRIGAKAGRGDVFIVEAHSTGGRAETGPLLVRRLIRATTIDSPPN